MKLIELNMRYCINAYPNEKREETLIDEELFYDLKLMADMAMADGALTLDGVLTCKEISDYDRTFGKNCYEELNYKVMAWAFDDYRNAPLWDLLPQEDWVVDLEAQVPVRQLFEETERQKSFAEFFGMMGDLGLVPDDNQQNN